MDYIPRFTLWIPALLLLSSCGVSPTKGAEFELTLMDPSTEEAFSDFPEGAYSLGTVEAALLNGAYSGVDLTFTKKDSTNSEYMFYWSLPFDSEDPAWLALLEGDGTPVTFTQSDFYDENYVSSRFNLGYKVFADPQDPDSNYNIGYLIFEAYTIEIVRFEIDEENRLSMSGVFVADTKTDAVLLSDAHYSIAGTFSFENVDLDLVEVE